MKRYLLAGAACVAMLISASCGDAHASAHVRPVTPVRAYKTDWAVFSHDQRFAATTEAETQLDLAFRTGGEVVSIYQTSGRALEPGDRVPASAVLARLRTAEYRARTQQAEAQWNDAKAGKGAGEASVREAEAAMAQAQEDYDRAKSLFDVQAMTRADFDAVRTRYDAQRARLTAARTAVESYQARIDGAEAATAQSRIPLDDTVIRAPFPAAIVARHVERGSTVAAGTVAYTLADLRRVKISFGIPDTALAEFTPGTKLTVSVSALPAASDFVAKVLAVSPVADPSTRLFRVTGIIDNARGALRAGLVATAALENPSEARELGVPLRAVRRLNNSDDGFAVLVIQGEHVLLNPVTLGPTSGSMVAVRSGLKSGDLVVQDSGTQLNSGDSVRIIP